MKHTRGILWFVFVMLAAAGLAVLVYFRATETGFVARSLEQIEREQGVSVTVTRPSTTDFTGYLYADAHLVASRRYFLRARISEVVEEVLVDAGEVVEEGELLVKFRDTDIEAEITAKQAAYQEARKNYERYKNLFDRGVVSADVVDSRLTAKENAAAALRQAKTRLQYTEVRSPAGESRAEGGSVQVARRMVDPGEFKGAGKELLTLIDLRFLEVKAHVPESGIAHLGAGQMIDHRMEGEGDWRPAKVKRISPSTEDPNRFFDVYLARENTRQNGVWQGRPGMYAEVRIPEKRVEDALSLPVNSIKWEGSHQYVFLVHESIEEEPVASAKPEQSSGGRLDRLLRRIGWGERTAETGLVETREVKVLRARRVEVETGLRNRGRVELRGDAVKPDDRVVCSPRVDLQDGSRLKIKGESCTQTARATE